MIGQPAPESKAQATTTVAGIKLEMHLLDDGRRVIAEPGFKAFCAALRNGQITTAEAAQLSMWIKRAIAN